MSRSRGAALVNAAALGWTGWGLLRMARFASSRHALPRVSDGAAWPARVTAVVPARDEADRIADCVAALCRVGPELVEVLVVDDGSTDETAVLAEKAGDGRVRVLTAPPLPPGSLGKPAACGYGAAQAAGDWLWFVDADVVVAPDTLRRLLALAEETGATLTSALGRIEGHPLLPEIGFALARRLDLDRDVFASGQCLLAQRSAYEEIGGHDAVRGEVVEDVALARLTGSSVVALAPDAYTVHMYDSLREAWDGLLKNSATVRSSAAVEMASALAVLGPLCVLAARPNRKAQQWAAGALSAQVLASAGARLVTRQPVAPAVLAPLAELALIANWVAGRRCGSVTWKSRRVEIQSNRLH